MHQDFQTWSMTDRFLLGAEYHTLYDAIDKHCIKYHKLPTIEELKYEIQDSKTLERLFFIDTVETDVEAPLILDYVKTRYVHDQLLGNMYNYADTSMLHEDAKEAIEKFYEIGREVENKIDLQDPTESMQKITLHETDDDISKYVPLGLNAEYDRHIQFSPLDLVMVGGKRGAGKSIVSCNIATTVYEAGKSAIYFTIEMDSRSILQRCCSIATGVPYSRLRTKNIDNLEWERVATWWAGRFLDSHDALQRYKRERSFDKFHDEVSKLDLKLGNQLDVVYDPVLTIPKIQAELDKKIKEDGNVGIVVVDYINQVRRGTGPSRAGQYDWTEQIEVSKALKSMAQEYKTTVFSPYQTDATGEARFAKGILDAADAAYTINAWTQEDACFTLDCVKMRSAAERSFTSSMDWETLKIGPDTVLNPKELEAGQSDESIYDV